MTTTGTQTSRLVVCPECDALQRVRPVSRQELPVCLRCGAHLRKSHGGGMQRVLPLTLAASICFVLANSWPIVAIEVAGNRSATSMLGAIVELYKQGAPGVALIVLLTGLLAPAAQLGLLAYALLSLAAPRRLPGVQTVVQLLQALRPWSMAEVFMLGALVSLVKLAGVARVIPGIGMWSLFGVIVLTAAAQATFGVPGYWEKARATG